MSAAKDYEDPTATTDNPVAQPGAPAAVVVTQFTQVNQPAQEEKKSSKFLHQLCGIVVLCAVIGVAVEVSSGDDAPPPDDWSADEEPLPPEWFDTTVPESQDQQLPATAELTLEIDISVREEMGHDPPGGSPRSACTI